MSDRIELRGTSFTWRVSADEVTGALHVALAGAGTLAIAPDGNRAGITIHRLVCGQVDPGRAPANTKEIER